MALASLVSSAQVAAAPGVATQPAPPSAAAASMFDDDLDMGAPPTAAGTKRCGLLFVDSDLDVCKHQSGTAWGVQVVCNTHCIALAASAVHESHTLGTAVLSAQDARPSELKIITHFAEVRCGFTPSFCTWIAPYRA